MLFRPTFVLGVAGPVPGTRLRCRRIGRERTYCTSLRLTRQQARRDLHEEEIMPHTRYIVVQHKDEWLIKFGDEEYGPYHSRAEAMLFALARLRQEVMVGSAPANGAKSLPKSLHGST
jgi:ribosomal protein S14